MRYLSGIVFVFVGLSLYFFYFVERAEYTYTETSFKKLPNWQQDDISQLYLPFSLQCHTLEKEEYRSFQLPILDKPQRWQEICEDFITVSPKEFKKFVEKNFTPYLLKSRTQMLYTGYYKPTIEASFQKTAEYKHPLYAVPKDIIHADLADFGVKDGGKISGRVVGDKFVPYYSRKDIDDGKFSAKVLLWVKSYVDKFFLQIQGSGTAVLPTKEGPPIPVAYAGNNGHGYTSIGKVLIEQGEMKREDVSLYSIKKWLYDYPEKAQELMHKNPRYIFFRLAEDETEGALKMPLIAERSLAVDPKYIPLGSLVFVATEVTANKEPFNKTFFAQDTGAAIKGADRADIFFGAGKKAERKAAYQNNKGFLYLLAPKV
jgi:membrane-bound lytic murein transglycosylase A